MSKILETILEAVRHLSLEEKQLLADKLSVEITRTQRPPLSAEEKARNLAIANRLYGSMKGLDRETIIKLAEDDEFCGY